MYNDEECEETRESLMKKIMEYNFTINELALYLDTHPQDQRAICMHKEYRKKAKDVADRYQKVYGPLTINYPCNKWRWLEQPWPWERGAY